MPSAPDALQPSDPSAPTESPEPADDKPPSPVAELSLVARLLGSAVQHLDPALRRFHLHAGRQLLTGHVVTHAPQGRLARLFARLLRAPLAHASGKLVFKSERSAHAETCIREFPSHQRPHRACSRLRVSNGLLLERRGLAELAYRLDPAEGMLTMHLVRLTVLGMRCPRALTPRVESREWGERGRLHFHLAAHFPGIGLVTSYRGWLELPPTSN